MGGGAWHRLRGLEFLTVLILVVTSLSLHGIGETKARREELLL